MSNYLFEFEGQESELCGEAFFVQTDSKHKAFIIAESNFPDEPLCYIGKFSDEEAEAMGFDTY